MGRKAASKCCERKSLLEKVPKVRSQMGTRRPPRLYRQQRHCLQGQCHHHLDLIRPWAVSVLLVWGWHRRPIQRSNP